MPKFSPDEFQKIVEIIAAVRRIEKQLVHVAAELDRVSEEVSVLALRVVTDGTDA